MNMVGIISFHLKRILKSPALMGTLVATPLFMTLLFVLLGQGNQGNGEAAESSHPNVATVILLEEGNEALRTALVAADFADNLWEDKARAHEALLKGEIGTIYEVPANYLSQIQIGQRPVIGLYHRDEATKSISFEYSFQQIVHDLVINQQLVVGGFQAEGQNFHSSLVDKVEVVKDQTGQAASPITAMMVVLVAILYILMAGVYIGGDLVSFKKNQTLRRSVMTPNHSLKITFSFLAAYAIFMSVVNMLLVTGVNLVYGADLSFHIRSLILVVLAVIVSLSFGLSLFRLFKNPQVCMSVGLLIWLVLSSLGVSGKFIQLEFLKNLSYISPTAWLFDILDSGQLFPGVIILLLMSAVLFTAGSYRLEDYVKR